MESILEINDTTYCLKLSKDAFDLAFVRRLLGKIERDRLFKQNFNEDDIETRTQRDHYDARFDRLSEK